MVEEVPSIKGHMEDSSILIGEETIPFFLLFCFSSRSSHPSMALAHFIVPFPGLCGFMVILDLLWCSYVIFSKNVAGGGGGGAVGVYTGVMKTGR